MDGRKDAKRSGKAPDTARAKDWGVVAVTGSSGLLGAPLVDRLAREGFTVVGFDRSGPPHPPTVAECICVDLESDASVGAALARLRHAYGDEIASVVHLAAFYDFSGEESPLYERITVRGTERLLRGLRQFTLGQFLFSSTALVHAPCQPGERVDENWPLEPKWPYPQSKVRAEAVIHRERGDAPSVVLRIAGVYTDRCQSIPLAHQIQRIHERRMVSHVFPGDTSHGQPFVHLDDVLDAIVAAVKRRRDLPKETVLLMGEGETLSYDTLQRELGRRLHGEDWETREIPKALAKTGAWLQDALPGEEPFIKPWMIDLADDHMELDVSRARELLEWSPRRSLRDTIPKMIAALKEDEDAWYRLNKLEPSSRVAPAAGNIAEPPHRNATRHSRSVRGRGI